MINKISRMSAYDHYRMNLPDNIKQNVAQTISLKEQDFSQFHQSINDIAVKLNLTYGGEIYDELRVIDEVFPSAYPNENSDVNLAKNYAKHYNQLMQRISGNPKLNNKNK